MTTKTFIVTVSNPGSGNKYFLDGVEAPTINFAEEGTYRFDDSDSSVAGHPLAFSTTDDGTHNGGSYYNTGTTRNGSPGQPGAYVEIVVARGAPNPLYYFCQNHSGMGGSINVTADSWGALKWGEHSWGAQDGVDVQITGQSLTSSISSVTAEGLLEEGWGGDTWGENSWGNLSDEVAVISGISLTATLGPLEFAGATTGWGRQGWGELGWGISGTVLGSGQELTSSIGSIASVTGTANIVPTGIELTATAVTPSIRTDVTFSVTGIEATLTGGEESVGIGVPVTGSSLTTSTGSVETFSSNGWGRGEWGEFAWGVNYSAAPSGNELTSTIGDAVGFTDFQADVTGQELSATFGNFSIQIDQDIFVFASEDQIDASTGTVSFEANANITVSGISASTSIGQVIPENLTTAEVTGSEISMTLEHSH